MESMRGSTGGGRRGGRSGFGAGRRGGGPGGRREPDNGAAREGRFTQVADSIDITVSEDELHVDDGERLRIYYLDGEKHERQLPNGDEVETVARRQGTSTAIEEKSARAEIEHEYELSPDGETMVLTMSVKMGRMKPVLIRSVYERGE